MGNNQSKITCIMGPTACGKTALALDMAEQDGQTEIINVDAQLVYQGLDIGTAKPSLQERRNIPHHLIDIISPEESYSVGEFCRDATQLIEDIVARGKKPLLVGGTMLYFYQLQHGIAELPESQPAIRDALQQRLQSEGLEVLYQALNNIDPTAAAKIKPTDKQRILRALEVFQITGKPLSLLWQSAAATPSSFQFEPIILAYQDRQKLHQRIAKRFQQMLDQGFVAEVEALLTRPTLTPQHPSMRMVGYRQVVAYLQGELSYTDMQEKAIIATRQLAKRQYTWLRKWDQSYWRYVD